MIHILIAFIPIPAALFLITLLSRSAFRRRRFAREYARLSKLFESGRWPEPGTIAKGEVKR